MVVRGISRYAQWLVIGALLTALTLLSLHFVFIPAFKGALSWIGCPDF
jgi:hypothetical protein